MPTSVVVCVICLFAGAAASARWLPDLAAGAIGGLVLVVVSGLLGMTLAVVGLHVYAIVELESTTFGHGTLLAGQLESMLLDAGLLLGSAAIVYLLAPRAHVAKRSATDAPMVDPSE